MDVLLATQVEAELGDSESDADETDETKTSKRKKKLESRLKIADLKQVRRHDTALQTPGSGIAGTSECPSLAFRLIWKGIL